MSTTDFIQETLPRAFDSTGLRELMDDSLYNLFVETMNEFGNGVTEEVAFDVDDYMPVEQVLTLYEKHRATSTGVSPCLAAACIPKPLSSSYYQDERFRELLRVGSLISGIDNDIQSQKKKEDGDWDYVQILLHRAGYTTEDATQAAVQRHHELIQKYHKLASELPEEVSQWSRQVGPSVFRGFVSWQSYAKRYKNKNSDQESSLLEKLFPGEPYHVVRDDGSYKGMDVVLHRTIDASTRTWAKETGILQVIGESKFDALDPALCSFLLYDYTTDAAFLQAFSKFFVWAVVIDDLWERPPLHKLTKETILTHLQRQA